MMEFQYNVLPEDLDGTSTVFFVTGNEGNELEQ